ncbi:MAG: 4-hydroxyphenylacetate 3-hydroxylase C-terminal domain-containing protein, partial [Thermomicrobiales bacterium]
MVTPSEADFQGAIGSDVRKYLQAAQGDAEERVKIFRLGWEIACSSFGGRQELYERFFFGDPVRMAGALYTLYDKEPYIARIRDFLNRDDTAEEAAARPAISSAPADIT